MSLPFPDQAGVSPFVTFFGSIGVDGADTIMNLVVLTAALSSLNAGLYSTGRILHSMSMAGSAPRFAGRMNKAGVPYGGIALTAVVTLLGVGLNAIVPAMVAGWFACRERIIAIADERSGFTGEFPVLANRPLADQQGRNQDDPSS